MSYNNFGNSSSFNNMIVLINKMEEKLKESKSYQNNRNRNNSHAPKNKTNLNNNNIIIEDQSKKLNSFYHKKDEFYSLIKPYLEDIWKSINTLETNISKNNSEIDYLKVKSSNIRFFFLL